MQTLDNHPVVEGMTVYCVSDYPYEISWHIVGKLDSGKAIYTESDKNGYIGCRAKSTFATFGAAFKFKELLKNNESEALKLFK